MNRFAPLALLVSLSGINLSARETIGRAVDSTPEAAPAFVAAAAACDMFEIESGRLALQRSRDPMHRMHAEMMIRDHTNTTTQLKAVAASAGVPVPATMLPMHAGMLNELSRASNFDAVYHRQQLSSHQQTLALMENFARHGDVPQLRGLAAATVPVVRGHLDHLRQMNPR